MAGFTNLLMLAVVMAGGPDRHSGPPPADSVCVRTTRYFPEVAASVRCFSKAGYRRWRQAQQRRLQSERLRQARTERERAVARRLDRREWEDKLRRDREDRRRQELRQVERRP